MASEPLVLGVDTSAAHCAAALLRGGETLAARAEEMGRGQAERLMPMIEEMLADTGIGWRHLDRIGVGIGPGNFTGIRISVAAARGLALALEIPAVGVDTFSAAELGGHGDGLPAVRAPREQVYLRPPGEAPRLATLAEAGAAGLPLLWPPAPAELAGRIARAAAGADADTTPAPAPLYIRPADAAPSAAETPVILD